MKFLILLALIGFTQAVPVSEPKAEVTMPELGWDNSLWNWFKEETDVRGPHMKCIESHVVVSAKDKKEEGETFLEWFKQWRTDMDGKTPEERLTTFKKDITVFQKYFKSFFGIYDTAVTSCRSDDKFSIVSFVDKFFELFAGLDDSSMKEIINEFYEESEEDTKHDETDDDETVCYKNSVPKLKECAKKYFSFTTYEEQGICESNYKKMIECLEQTAHKCSKDTKSEITVVGSVLFRFMYDACHHH